MNKKQTKHFIPYKDYAGTGTPACNCFQDLPAGLPDLAALLEESAKGRRDTNCGNCQRTRVFRKLK